MTESAAVGQETPKTKGILGAVLSGLLPGTGHLHLNERKSGLVHLAVFVSFLALAIYLRFAGSYPGYIVCLVVPTAFCIFSSANAIRRAHQRSALNWRWWLTGFVAALLAQFIYFSAEVRGAGFAVFGVPSLSMQPAIAKDDVIMVDRRAFQSKKPARGDVIVFKHHDGSGVELKVVKRVVALPGDYVEGTASSVRINAQALEEKYANYEGLSPVQYQQWGPYQVPQGSYFVVGDHRNISLDSRMPGYGFVRESDLIGRPIYVFQSKSDQRLGIPIR